MDHAILKQQIVVIYLIMSIYTVYKSRIGTLPWCLAELTHPGLHNNNNKKAFYTTLSNPQNILTLC